VGIKRPIGIITGFLLICNAFAQDFHFSQFMQNMVYVNPAYAALPTSGEAGLTYRNQWPGIPATFVTYGAALVMPVKMLNGGVGVHFINDMQGSGVIIRTIASLQYGYRISLNAEWSICTGLGASYVLKKFNAAELVFRSDILNDLGYGTGTVTFDNYNRTYADFNAGIIATNNNNLSFGFSASHLTRPHDTFSNQVGSRMPIKYTGFVSGRLDANGVAVEPAVYYSQQQNNNELVWGSQFVIGSTFMAGGFLRQNLRFNPDALIIVAGISWENYNIAYSYDVNLKKMRFLSTKMAAHEVTFLYRFEYKQENIKTGQRHKQSKKVECPAYL